MRSGQSHLSAKSGRVSTSKAVSCRAFSFFNSIVPSLSEERSDVRKAIVPCERPNRSLRTNRIRKLGSRIQGRFALTAERPFSYLGGLDHASCTNLSRRLHRRDSEWRADYHRGSNFDNSVHWPRAARTNKRAADHK